jgi:hypothetical protein
MSLTGDITDASLVHDYDPAYCWPWPARRLFNNAGIAHVEVDAGGTKPPTVGGELSNDPRP